MGYRFDYKGRSVVVSGDTLVTETTIEASDGVDLVIHDAMMIRLVQAAAGLQWGAGNTRIATALDDIQGYHATTGDLQRLMDSAIIGQLALYDLVPSPRNAMALTAFSNAIPEGSILTEDGMVFSLPAESDLIDVEQ